MSKKNYLFLNDKQLVEDLKKGDESALAYFFDGEMFRKSCKKMHNDWAIKHKCRITLDDFTDTVRKEIAEDPCVFFSEHDKATERFKEWFAARISYIAIAMCAVHDIKLHQGLLRYDNHSQDNEDYNYVFQGKEYGEIFGKYAYFCKVEIGDIRSNVHYKFYDSNGARKGCLHSYDTLKKIKGKYANNGTAPSDIWEIYRSSHNIMSGVNLFSNWFETAIKNASFDICKDMKRGKLALIADFQKKDADGEPIPSDILDDIADDCPLPEPVIEVLKFRDMVLNISALSDQLGREKAMTIKKFLQKLTDKKLAIVLLKIGAKKYSSKEIAKELGIKPGNVDTVFKRLKDHLKAELEKIDESENQVS